MKSPSSTRSPSLASKFKGPVLSGFAFFSTVAVLSVGYAAYSALQTVGTASSGSQILSAEWNKMVSNFASVNSQLSSLDVAATSAASQISSLSSQVSGLSVNGGNPWVSGASGISYSSGSVALGKAPASASFEVRRSASDAEYVSWFEGAWSGNHGVGVNVAGTTLASNVAHFRSGNVSRFLVRADGNVGIGNSAPAYPLDVTGDVRFTGTLQGGTVPAARVSGLGTLATKSAVASADITDASVATADIADSAVTDAKVASGISPSKLASGGATSGQVLSWNGSAWVPGGGSSEYSGPRFATLLRNGSFTVPQGVTSITVRLIGGGGGAGEYYGGGGGGATCIKRGSTAISNANGWAGWRYANGVSGARVSTTVSVTPGETLDIFVGAGGGGGSNWSYGGGGGGGWGWGGGGYYAWGGGYGGGGGGGANAAGAAGTVCGNSGGGGGAAGGGGGTASGGGAGYTSAGGGGWWGSSSWQAGAELSWGTFVWPHGSTLGGVSMNGQGWVRSIVYRDAYNNPGHAGAGGDGGMAHISW